MGLKYRNLFDQIVEIDNLQLAYKNTKKGKKETFSYLEFKEFDQFNLNRLRNELINEEYQIGQYRNFFVYDPKKRLISALSFKDRIVQHAICNIITPIFEKTFLPNSFACRKGYGTHAGVRYVQSNLRKHKFTYFLKTDFSKYFPSIDTTRLLEMIRKKIKCNKTFELIKLITPPNQTGIPIGNLTSQLFANVYGNDIDYFIKHKLKVKYFARYMDDIVILDNNKKFLRDVFVQLEEYCRNHLKLNMGKWHVACTHQGINFLGYRIWKDYKLLRKQSVVRAKRKVNKYLSDQDYGKLVRFLASWHGHIQWSNSYNIKYYIDNLIKDFNKEA